MPVLAAAVVELEVALVAFVGVLGGSEGDQEGGDRDEELHGGNLEGCGLLFGGWD